MTCFIFGKWRHSPTFIYVQYTISAGKAQGVVVKMNQQARAYRGGAPRGRTGQRLREGNKNRKA